MEKPKQSRIRFWPVFGITFGGAFIITLLYTLIVPGISLLAWSNALCTAALALGAITLLPILLDTGRSIFMVTKIGASPEEKHAAIATERQRREVGMTFTYAVGLAMLFIGILSMVFSLI